MGGTLQESALWPNGRKFLAATDNPLPAPQPKTYFRTALKEMQNSHSKDSVSLMMVSLLVWYHRREMEAERWKQKR